MHGRGDAAAEPGLADADRAVIGLDLDQERAAPRLHPGGAGVRRLALVRQRDGADILDFIANLRSPRDAKSHCICIGGVKSPLATVWRAGRECGSGNISTQYLLRVGRSARSVIHTVILMMSSGVPPAVSITRRTLANIAAHCASRSSGTLPVAGSAPEIAPETTNGPRRLALGIGLTCRAPATSMLRRFSMIASSQPTRRDDRDAALEGQLGELEVYGVIVMSPTIPAQSWSEQMSL